LIYDWIVKETEKGGCVESIRSVYESLMTRWWSGAEDKMVVEKEIEILQHECTHPSDEEIIIGSKYIRIKRRVCPDCKRDVFIQHLPVETEEKEIIQEKIAIFEEKSRLYKRQRANQKRCKHPPEHEEMNMRGRPTTIPVNCGLCGQLLRHTQIHR
jgi:hypothetical protein